MKAFVKYKLYGKTELIVSRIDSKGCYQKLTRKCQSLTVATNVKGYEMFSREILKYCYVCYLNLHEGAEV